MSGDYRVTSTLFWTFTAENDDDAEDIRQWYDDYGTRPDEGHTIGREVKLITGWENE